MRHRPAGLGAMTSAQGIQSQPGGFPTSPVHGPIGSEKCHDGVALFCDCAHRRHGGCRGDLEVTQPENTLWIGLAHSGHGDHSDSNDPGKGKDKGNDDDNGGDGGGDGGDGEGDKGLGSRNKSKSPPASAKGRTSEEPPMRDPFCFD